MPAASVPSRVLFLARHVGLGGVTTHMMTLARALQREGVAVAVASRSETEDGALGPVWFESHGIPHYPIPFPRPAAPPTILRDGAASLRALEATADAFRPDLVHVHWRSTSAYAAWLRRLHGIPFVTTLHSEHIPSTPRHRLVSFWGAATICVSREAAVFLQRTYRRPDGTVFVIPLGVDPVYFHPPSTAERAHARAQLGLPRHEPVLTMLGRLTEEKGIDVFLDALAHLAAEGLRPAALIAGEGDAELYQDRAERLGLAEQIRFAGFTDARTALWASDVLVLPSRREGFPMTVVEAMHCGVVPVRTPAGGSREQVEDCVSGYIVPFDDAYALAQRLARLVLDPDLRVRMRTAARQRALERFTTTQMARAVQTVYGRALHAPADST